MINLGVINEIIEQHEAARRACKEAAVKHREAIRNGDAARTEEAAAGHEMTRLSVLMQELKKRIGAQLDKD